MTSDAKIGLLLGLVFIFIIAFIINGLPSFRNETNNNELTTNMVSSQDNPPGLGAKERKAREVINRIERVKKQSLAEVQTQPTSNQDIRFTTPLPKSPSVAKETIEVKPVASAQPLPTVKKNNIHKIRPNKTIPPKTYVVKEGDSLAVIAKKFYGPEDGNKRTSIARIFEANTKFLKSPDEIYEGQKLIIPPLPALASNASKVSDVLASPMLEKVESIGKRHLPAYSRRIKQSKWYVVREGDSLWRIAAERLGNGSRYSEIAKLNTDIIDDEDNLVVGMRLKMPAR